MSKSSVSTDIRLKDFWRDDARFADLANAVIFDGRSIIKPESLHELDTDMSGIVEFKDYEKSLAKLRDVVKKTAYGIDFVILSLENQQDIHYAMPLRTMIYDGLGYLKEYQDVSRTYKNTDDKNTKEKSEEVSKDEEVLTHQGLKETFRKTSAKKVNTGKIRLTKDEYLSKFRKDDRLHPIITIVISYSEKPWDGPLSLHDMMLDMSPEMDRFFSDYRMNLIEVRDSEQYIFHNKDVKDVFEICREIFCGNLDSIRNNYKDIDISIDAANAIRSITNISTLFEMNKKGVTNMNMCTALEDLKNEGKMEGKMEILIQLVNDGLISISDAAEKLNVPISQFESMMK